MANEKHRKKEDAQRPDRGDHIPKNEAPPEPPAPNSHRNADQGKLQQSYDAQQTEGMRSADDRLPRRDEG